MPDSDGEILLGQLYDREQDVVVKFTEQMMGKKQADQIWGQARTEMSPNDMKSTKVRVYDPTVVEDIWSSAPSTTNINLPDTLAADGIGLTINKNFGNGEDVKEVGVVFAMGSSGSASMTPSARAQSSGAIQLDCQPNIKQTWGQNVPVTVYSFLMPGNFTSADIVTRLEGVVVLKTCTSPVVTGTVTITGGHGMVVGQPFQFRTLVAPTSGGIAINTTYYVRQIVNANVFNYSLTNPPTTTAPHNAGVGSTFSPEVLDWPKFKPEAITITLNGQQTNIGQNAESALQYSWSGEDNKAFVIIPYTPTPTRSDGYSYDVGTSVRSVRIPPTLHPEITLSLAPDGVVDTILLITTVNASTPALVGEGGAPDFAAIINTPAPLSALVKASVSPLVIPATVPPSIPKYGLYIVDVQVRPYAYGFQRVTVVVVDFSWFA